MNERPDPHVVRVIAQVVEATSNNTRRSVADMCRALMTDPASQSDADARAFQEGYCEALRQIASYMADPELAKVVIEENKRNAGALVEAVPHG